MVKGLLLIVVIVRAERPPMIPNDADAVRNAAAVCCRAAKTIIIMLVTARMNLMFKKRLGITSYGIYIGVALLGMQPCFRYGNVAAAMVIA